MAKFSITNERYGYFRDSKWPSEAVDIHHVVVLRNKSGQRGFLFCIFAALAFCFFLLKGESIFVVFWCLVLNVFFAKKLLGGTVEKESVMVMPNFGVQLETHYISGKVVRRFVPVDRILKPILVECVTPVTCYWSLSLIVQREEQLLLVFKELCPPVKMLVPIWKALCALLPVPVMCLLVKGWKGSSCSFPRGKKSKDEEDHACAIREVLEETGFDVTNLLRKSEYIEVIFGQQRVRLYIIAGVKDDTAFAPLTKKEISEIAWHRLDDFEPGSGNVISRGLSGLKLYMVAPFLASLRSWISTHQPPVAPNPDVPSRGLIVWKAKNSSIGSSNTIVMESQLSKPEVDVLTLDTGGPGRSFRNFKFDTASILQSMEMAFS